MKVQILKTTFLLMVLFGVLNKTYSQSFDDHRLKKLESFGININEFELNNSKIYEDFSSMLTLDKKRRTNKTWSIVLASFSLVYTTLGIVALSEKNVITNAIGGMALGVGIISGGVSIPLFNSSRNRKEERDELIRKYKIVNNN